MESLARAQVCAGSAVGALSVAPSLSVGSNGHASDKSRCPIVSQVASPNDTWQTLSGPVCTRLWPGRNSDVISRSRPSIADTFMFGSSGRRTSPCSHVSASETPTTVNVSEEAVEEEVPIEKAYPASPTVLDVSQVRDILPHRYPFLLVDQIVEFEPGKSAVGIKNVTINDDFFPGYSPVDDISTLWICMRKSRRTQRRKCHRSSGGNLKLFPQRYTWVAPGRQRERYQCEQAIKGEDASLHNQGAVGADTLSISDGGCFSREQCSSSATATTSATTRRGWRRARNSSSEYSYWRRGGCIGSRDGSEPLDRLLEETGEGGVGLEKGGRDTLLCCSSGGGSRSSRCGLCRFPRLTSRRRQMFSAYDSRLPRGVVTARASAAADAGAAGWETGAVEAGSTSADSRMETVGEDHSLSVAEKVSKFRDAFWRFLRPHTIRGTLLGTTALVVRALMENSHAINWSLTPRALRGLLALLCGNGYIVGINQIYDVSIDKVNKPFLPVAAGDLSPAWAWALCLLLSGVGIGIVATNFGRLITTLYCSGLFLGTLYSVPPLRLKQNPLLAFLIIACVRGVLLNFGVYYATRAALGLQFAWSPSVAFITVFVTLFATAIAITKDLPDVEGDRQFNIATFATRLGVRTISMTGTAIILSNYVGAVVLALRMPMSFNLPVMIGGHMFLALALGYNAWELDKAGYTKQAIVDFYRFIWNLFYAEYIMFPFI